MKGTRIFIGIGCCLSLAAATVAFGAPRSTTAVYGNGAHGFAFRYPVNWKQLKSTPPSEDQITLRAPSKSGREQLEVHIVVGPARLEGNLRTENVRFIKDHVTVGAATGTRLRYAIKSNHGSPHYERSVAVAVPLGDSGDVFVNIIGFCSTKNTRSKCSDAIDGIINRTIIPSFRFSAPSSKKNPLQNRFDTRHFFP